MRLLEGMPVRRTLLQALLGVAMAGCKPSGGWLARKAASAQGVRWVAFYGETGDEQALSAYDLVVLDPTFQGSKALITGAGARLCGYLSLGEIRAAETFFPRLDPRALLEENPAWPGTRRVDVRHGSWKSLVLNEVIPAIAAKGFTGLLLDTLDTPPYLEQQDPVGNRGMRQSAIDLVIAIRRTHPDMLVIMNRGYDLLPDVMRHLDGIVAESLLTAADGNETRCCRWNKETDINLQLSLLAPSQKGRNRLPILSLDYWEPGDTGTITEIYQRERRLGHHPYVATPLLNTIVREPAA